MIRADRGAHAAAFEAVRPGRFVAVEVVRVRPAKALRVPARSVIAEVVVDIPRVAPEAPIARRAPVARRARVAIPNVKVISFAAHASSLVARRPQLRGMRPLPEGRACRCREPAKVKRYLLETMCLCKSHVMQEPKALSVRRLRPLAQAQKACTRSRSCITLRIHWLVRARRLRRTAGSPVPRT